MRQGGGHRRVTVDRYTNEVNRLYGVLDRRLADREFIAGDYSIADMACYPWAKLWNNQGQDISTFANLRGWLDRCAKRPAVARGMAVAKEARQSHDLASDKEAQKIMFGQKAR
jgi:GST-like protein